MVGHKFQKLFNNQNEGCEPDVICYVKQDSCVLFTAMIDVKYRVILSLEAPNYCV